MKNEITKTIIPIIFILLIGIGLAQLSLSDVSDLQLNPILTIDKSHYSVGEPLEFEFQYFNEDQLDSISISKNRTNFTSTEDKWESKDETLEVNVLRSGIDNGVPVKIEELRTGRFKITIEQPRSLPAGRNTLRFNLTHTGREIEVEGEFMYGVLAINTHKSVYLPNEYSFISIGILNSLGMPYCISNATLLITSPNSTVTTLSTENNMIKISEECHIRNITSEPDYSTNYTFGGVGGYVFNLTATTGDATLSQEENISVVGALNYEISRDTATRIYPFIPYPSNITIKSNKLFVGSAYEFVPIEFEITPQRGLTVTNYSRDEKRLEWSVSFLPGQSIDLGYEYNAPDLTPYKFLIGKMQIDSFEEYRYWQIASDADQCTGATEACSVHDNDALGCLLAGCSGGAPLCTGTHNACTTWTLESQCTLHACAWDGTAPVISSLEWTDDSEHPFYSLSTTPILGLFLDETGDCRMSFSDESYDDMSNDITCAGTQSIECTVSPPLTPELFTDVFIACCDVFDNCHTAGTNTAHNITNRAKPEISFVSPTPGDMAVVEDGFPVNISANDTEANDTIIYSFIDFERDVLAWVTFDTTVGTEIIVDNSTYGFGTVTPIGDVHKNQTENSGVSGYSFVYDGNGDYHTFNHFNNLHLDFGEGNLSWSIWVKPNEILAANMGLVAKKNGGASERSGIAFMLRSDFNGIRVSIGNGTDNINAQPDWDITSNLTDGDWHHVLINVQRDSNLDIWFDGGKVESRDISGFSGNNLNTTQALEIGRGLGGAFNGSLDEFIWFNRSLNESEILSLFNATAYPYSRNFTGLADGPYQVRGHTKNVDGGVNRTETRTFLVGSGPEIIVNEPANASLFPLDTLNITINITVIDHSSEVGHREDVFIYASNETANRFEFLIVKALNLTNATDIIYNFTSLPVDKDNPDLLALWHFDNLTLDTTAFATIGAGYDWTGNDNNMSIEDTGTPNTTYDTQGKFAWGVKYDGDGDESTEIVVNRGILNGEDNVSINLWMRRVGDGLTGYENLYIEGAGRAGYELTNSCNDNALTWTMRSGAAVFNSISVDNTFVSNGDWHMVTGVTDGVNQQMMWLYVDGELVNSSASTVTSSNPTIGVSIGGHNGNSVCDRVNEDAWFNGTLDEISIWNKSLSADEVKDMYRHKIGRYFWQVNITDGTAFNSSSILEFNVSKNPKPSFFSDRFWIIANMTAKVFKLGGGGDLRIAGSLIENTMVLADKFYTLMFHRNTPTIAVDDAGNLYLNGTLTTKCTDSPDGEHIAYRNNTFLTSWMNKSGTICLRDGLLENDTVT